MQTKPSLSVNINKIALLRNARGGDVPNLIQFAKDCERFGANGITVHPRPDERHIRYADIPELKKVVTTEFNIEGYPSQQFMDLVLATQPDQCTLVPDPPEALTSNTGWDTLKHQDFLKEIVATLQANNIRVSLFIDPIASRLEAAATIQTERIEFYTGPYAAQFEQHKDKAIEPFTAAAAVANKLGLGINAGHDLDLRNLAYFKQHIPNLLEVSIGHALVKDCLYFGLENVISLYQRQLR